MPTTAPVECSSCKTQPRVGSPKTGKSPAPRGWKRLGDDFFCPACWKSRYILRATTFPVSGPVDRTWPELNETLSACWNQTTSLANWAVTETAKADVVRMPGDVKLPSLPRVYLYPQARQLFPALDAQTVAATLRAVQMRYRAARLNVIWRGAATLPRYRYPYPISVCAQSWRASFGDDGALLVRVRLGTERWTLRLRTWPGGRREVAAFRRIVTGEAVQSELSLVRQRASSGDHRAEITARAPGGGRQVVYKVMAKLAAWHPRPPAPEARSGQMELRSGSDHLWVAVVAERPPWFLNADHVRRWVAAHRRFLERIREDTKREKRVPSREMRQIKDALSVRCEKQHRRIHTFCHQAARMLAEYADRQRVAEVIYDDRNRSYLADFNWSLLQTVLRDKLDQKGIRLTVVRGASLGGATADGSEEEGG